MQNAKERAIYYKNIKKHLLRQTDKCALCLNPILTMKEATIDHIIPISRGGSEHISNLQLAHEKCNQQKGNALPTSQENE